jgi:ureidoglycolate lyase
MDIQITAAALTPSAFARFGSVIENPRPDLHPTSFTTAGSLPFYPVSANQGTAIKYQHVSRMLNLYDYASVQGDAVMNMFVCAARKLGPHGTFNVSILERHPFTTQTFIPLSSDPATTYLVIVAPSLPPTAADEGLPVPGSRAAPASAQSAEPPHALLPGRGLPDLRNLKAFVASAGQAVTYGAGTWHAPMVALGTEGTKVDFVVVQFANGVPIEDCQEVVFSSRASSTSSGHVELAAGASGVVVRVPDGGTRAKL